MSQQWKRWGMAVVAFLLAGLIVACQETPSTVSEPGNSSDCRSITHFAGTTCVPNSFERLITMDSVSFEHAIALGVKPIATVVPSLTDHLSDQLNGVENIGRQGAPALESMVVLNPDLVVGLDYHQLIYTQASQMAPTVLLKFEHSGQWKESFQAVAQILGREDAAQQVMDDYNRRIQDFKARMGDRHPIVSVARIYPNSINPYLRESFPGTVLQDAGLARPPAQDVGADEAQRIANNPIQMTLGRESLSQIDGDVLFVWTAENEPEANQEAQRKLEALKNDPLWKTLNVVQKNQVYLVPSYWIGAGPIAANAILDDLFKYLIEAPAS